MQGESGDGGLGRPWLERSLTSRLPPLTRVWASTCPNKTPGGVFGKTLFHVTEWRGVIEHPFAMTLLNCHVSGKQSSRIPLRMSFSLNQQTA